VRIAIARHGEIRGERRSADGAEVHLELEMPFDAERVRDGSSRLDFARVALSVEHAERVQREALRLRDRRSGIRIEATAQEYYCAHLVNG
jgi:hypothetical protein